jgi:hypothetical protein
MFRWKKLGRVFNPREARDRSWLREFAQAPCTLLFDNFVRVYFSCRPAPDENGQYRSYTAFIDLKRANLFEVLRLAAQPILPLGGFGEFDEFGTYPVSVIRDGRNIVAYYGGWTRCESVPFNVAIGAAKSFDDGETFVKLGRGPVVSYSPDEPFVLSGPKIRRFGDRWYLFYIVGHKWKIVDSRPEPVYRIRMAWSTDGIVWSKAGRNLIETRLEEDEAQASPDVFFRDGRYHMFFCYRRSADFRGRANGYRIGYAVSEDLWHWTRDDTKAGIDVAEEGWDSEMISYPHLFELDGETYMFYLGNQVGREGFGLARLEGEL